MWIVGPSTKPLDIIPTDLIPKTAADNADYVNCKLQNL